MHQRAILRNVIAAGTKIAQLGYTAEGSQAEDVVNLAQAEVYEMSTGKVRQDYAPIGTVIADTLDQLDRLQSGEVSRGVPTGFRDIDDVTQGLQPGQMIVVAGRPAMGKSTLGVDFARSAALHHGLTTIIFSLEMSKNELAQRIISAESNIPLAAMRRADDITPERWAILNELQGKLQNAPLFIDDSPNMSLMEIRAKCRRLKQTNDLKLVVIDYLQLMTSGKAVESRQQEVSDFSRALKLLAKELEVPVVALSQLNRGPEMRQDKKPQLSDLRESGSIEQDADVVFLVHRPDAYDKEDRRARPTSSWRSIVTVRPTRSILRSLARIRSSRTCPEITSPSRRRCDMAWNSFATPLIGKAVRAASRLAHGGGSAFPGKIVERIDPQFLSRTLAQLPLGVVLVSGTNGKTTTTRMVASMLQSLGLKVFTNPTGSNFTRGVVSSLLAEVSLSGKLDADIAVLELDEAYAVHFVKQVPPDYCLLLNVMRDQLDRFGEIDNTARLLSKAAEATTGTVVLNREDPRIARLADVAHTEDGVEVRYFGLDESLRGFFPSDDDMSTTVDAEAHDSAEHGGNIGDSGNAGDTADAVAAAAPATSQPQDGPDALPADVTLRAVGDHRATFAIDGETYETAVKLEGVYNLYNAAAALAVVRAVAADAQAMFLPFEDALADSVDADGPDAGTETDGNGSHDAIDRAAADEILRAAGVSPRMIAFAHATTQAMIDTAGEVTPAFGRGEVITVNDTPVELLLVKNPMGFRLSLASFKPEGCDTMICINDEYADGRDMSWLWDVDFTSLRGTGVKAVSGVRAWDMALRLEYDQVPVESVSTDLEESVVNFVNANSGTPKHIYCTYTAMLKTRAALAKIADVADAGVGK